MPGTYKTRRALLNKQVKTLNVENKSLPEGMQKGGETLHETKDTDGENCPSSKDSPENYPSNPSPAGETNPHDH